MACRCPCTCFPPPNASSTKATSGCGQPVSARTRLRRRVAEAIESGALDAATLERCTSPDAAAMLRGIKGIGPWTATIILLRGLGRLDVFPGNDASVASNIALAAGSAPLDVPRVLDALGPQRGMLYFHLLLGRLEARGDIGRQSFERLPSDDQSVTPCADDSSG